MRVPNAVTAVMMKWIDSGCEYTKENPDRMPDMQGILRSMCGRKSPEQVAETLKAATAATLAFDIGSGGASILALPLLHALLNDDKHGIDWVAIAEKYRSVPENN